MKTVSLMGGSCRTRVAFLIPVAFALGSCATGPRVAPPSEIPALQAELRESPDDPEIRQVLSASLAANGECQQASQVAAEVPSTPDRSWPVLVAGRCLEADGRLDEAVASYESYLTRFPEGDARVLVEGQLLLARERRAVARVAGADPEDLPPAPEETVAVLPLSVAGPDAYARLGRGLAAQISSDLLTLDRFRMVERLELQAVLDELERSRSPLVNATTSPEFGRVVQAGRLVSGTLEIPGQADVGLQASVVRSSGEVIPTERLQGETEDLLALEKELVFEIAAALGYQVSEAERVRILENGTRNLQAFLAYSEGLELADGGDYMGAAASFAEAYRLDGSFVEAREMLEASVGAETMSAGGDGAVLQPPAEIQVVVADVAAGGRGDLRDPINGVITASVNDMAPTQGEQAMGTSTEAPGSGTTGTIGTITAPRPPPPTLPEINPIRIRLRFPIPGGGS